jgi:hypothetical protein
MSASFVTRHGRSIALAIIALIALGAVSFAVALATGLYVRPSGETLVIPAFVRNNPGPEYKTFDHSPRGVGTSLALASTGSCNALLERDRDHYASQTSVAWDTVVDF